MDDLVAVAVKFSEGGTRYFLAYGRIFGAVDDDAVEAVVLKAAKQSDYVGTPLQPCVRRSMTRRASRTSSRPSST